MILFNLLLNHQISANYYKNFQALNNHKPDNLISTTYKPKFNVYGRTNTSIILLSSNNNHYNDGQKYYTINEHNRMRIFSNTFLARFINKYWKETIFLSLPDPSLQVKVKKSYTDKLSVYSNEYKNLLISFSKALINGRIQVCMQSDNEIINTTHYKLYNQNPYWQIVWKKEFNFFNFKDVARSIFVYIQMYVHNTNTRNVLSKMINIPLPLFTILNDFDQIVLAESSNKMLENKHFIDFVYHIYRNLIISQYNRNTKYLALFFVNHQDALEYRRSIQRKYYNITSQSMKLFPVKLNIYYKLYSIHCTNTDFRIIPDLKEVQKLIKKYQYYKNISFQADQKYGKDYFQGQPIYRIKPSIAVDKRNNRTCVVDYTYNIMNNQKLLNYEAVFFNYDTAINAWLKFKKQMNHYYLPHHPQLDIYNLESFINNYEKNKMFSKHQIIFIPSRESYKYIKTNLPLASQLNLVQKFMNTYVYFKIITKRIIWSLTSRQPIHW